MAGVGELRGQTACEFESVMLICREPIFSWKWNARTAESMPSSISHHSPRPVTPWLKHSMKRDSDSMGLSSTDMLCVCLGVTCNAAPGHNVIFSSRYFIKWATFGVV